MPGETRKGDLFANFELEVESIWPTHLYSVTPSTPHIYVNKGMKIQILIKSIFKTFLNTSLSNG